MLEMVTKYDFIQSFEKDVTTHWIILIRLDKLLLEEEINIFNQIIVLHHVEVCFFLFY